MSDLPDRPLVDRATLDLRVAEALAGTSGQAGVFGPESVTWRVFRHSHVYLLGTALSGLLDAAHPWVARGIIEHSTLFDDPRKRAEQTYLMLTRIVFGDEATVRKMSRYLHTLHGKVEGELPEDARYAANDVSALLFVYLVGFWTRLSLYERTVAELTPAERDRYVVESHRFAACFGVPADLLPADHAAFERRFQEFVRTDLKVTEDGRRIVPFLLEQVPAVGRASFLALVREVLPGEVLDALELPRPTRATRLHGRSVLRTMGVTARSGPAGFRFLPAYHEAMARTTGATVPRGSARLNRAILGRKKAL